MIQRTTNKKKIFSKKKARKKKKLKRMKKINMKFSGKILVRTSSLE
jgi:hypothetical protein